jgi:SAM-dependent methyltransferase
MGESRAEVGAEGLFKKDPTGRFSGRESDYRKFRPSYPDAAIDAVLEGMGDPKRLTVADVGAGTGISSRLLADRRARVIAVEPNAAMRGAAEGHPGVEWRDGRAEATGLANGSVDVVVCAQSFHWFEPTSALAEFARVLRPGGRVALVWNDKDLEHGVTAEYARLVRTAAAGDAAMEDHTRPGPLYASALFKDVREIRARYEQRLDEEGLVGRATSASYVPREGERLRALVEGLRRVHAENADEQGLVTLAYWTRVFMGERCSRGSALSTVT